MSDYGKLKSGTDIRGRAIASEGKPAVLTEQAVKDIAGAFLLWLTRRTGKQRCKISVGRDSRLTGEGFASAIMSALGKTSVDIFDCGLFSTPASFMTTQFPSMAADGAIMITASHHPRDINGLKFFTADGGVSSAELDEIIELANGGEKVSGNGSASVLRRDFLRLYCDAMTDIIRKGTGLFLPLKGLKIAVDAGHGAGGFFANRVIAPLGGDVSPSQFLEPDGNFPAHSPNPENAEAIGSLKARVLETGADLGIIFDTDVDRCAIVTSDGTEVNRCRLIALAAAMVLDKRPGATIVTDSVTTEGLRRFIERRGGIQKRFKRGYRNVIDEAKRLNDCGVDAPLAIESSGHAAFAEHYFLDDGAYFITKILVELANLRKCGKTLEAVIGDLENPLEEIDARLTFTSDGWRELADKIITRLGAMSERMLKLSGDNYEGVRAYVSHADGYFIVRTSVHDPVLPIYIESNKRGGAKSIARLLYAFLKDFIGLDCTPLHELIVDGEQYADVESTENVRDVCDERAAENADVAQNDGFFEQSEYAEPQECSEEQSEYSEQDEYVDVQDENAEGVEDIGFDGDEAFSANFDDNGDR